jgi:hypothetical protein
MAKIWVQNMPAVLDSSGSLVASGSISGSKLCDGYSNIVGIAYNNASSVAGCALFIEQSADQGTSWDWVSACNLSADSGSGYNIVIVGDAVRIRFHNGADNSTAVRMLWRLRPV